MLVVTETFTGLCAVGRGECAACGWVGLDQFDVGLVRVGANEYEHDEEPVAECPNCHLHECRVDLNPGLFLSGG